MKLSHAEIHSRRRCDCTRVEGRTHLCETSWPCPPLGPIRQRRARTRMSRPWQTCLCSLLRCPGSCTRPPSTNRRGTSPPSSPWIIYCAESLRWRLPQRTLRVPLTLYDRPDARDIARFILNALRGPGQLDPSDLACCRYRRGTVEDVLHPRLPDAAAAPSRLKRERLHLLRLDRPAQHLADRPRGDARTFPHSLPATHARSVGG